MRDKVFQIVSKVMRVPVETINEDSSPDTIAAWDSLTHINLVLALEEEFGVQFSDEQMVEMLNVRLIILSLQEIANKSN